MRRREENEPNMNDRITDKFGRIFDDLDELKQRVAKIETRDEIEHEQLASISEKVDRIAASLHEILGKEAVRSSVYGVIGAIVSGIVVWIVTLARGGAQ